MSLPQCPIRVRADCHGRLLVASHGYTLVCRPSRELYGERGLPIDKVSMPGFLSLQLMTDRFILNAPSTSPVTAEYVTP